MSVPKLQFLVSASAEVGEAFDWYQARSSRAAARFLAEIERAVILIRESPEVWPPFEAGTRRYLLRSFPYSIIYRPVNDALQIVAVAHQKRRPGYWRSRPGA